MTSFVVEGEWLGTRIRTFRDLIPDRPRALLVGLNPSPVSLDQGHYHQGRLGQRMWRRLEEAGVLPHPPPGRFHDEFLADLGLGLTDLVKRPSRRSDDLTAADFAHGRARLLALLDRVRPPLVCFIYKLAAEKTLGRLPARSRGLLSARLCTARVFLFPGPYAEATAAHRVLRRLSHLLKGRL
jgi:TDG/mug DNA glycosylase family protein